MTRDDLTRHPEESTVYPITTDEARTHVDQLLIGAGQDRLDAAVAYVTTREADAEVSIAVRMDSNGCTRDEIAGAIVARRLEDYIRITNTHALSGLG